MLDVAEITAEAEKRANIDDPEAAFRENLRALVASINEEGQLSAKGEESTREALIKRVAYRLDGLRWLRDHPEVAEESINEPVFLTGLPRSGTTYFQYLFDCDPRFRLIRTWEANDPSPPPGYDPESARRRLEEEKRRRENHLVKGFAAMHLSDPEGPEECHAFLEQSFAAAGFYNLLNVPSYFGYLLGNVDFEAAYRAHKRQLQLLQWRMPQARWALKYPNHVLAMDAILAVYPDARFVMTHRDPVQTLASISKLTLTLRQLRSDAPVDPHQVGRQMLDFVRRHIDRILAFDRSPQGNRVTHVDYYRLVDDPVGIMPEVHRDLGIDTPDQVREAMADWRRRNPKGAQGANPYALENFGLEQDEVEELFRDYMERFDVPREKEGLARIGEAS